MFNNLFRFTPDPYNNILENFMDVSNQLVPGIMPFGRDPGGNLICFDYRSGGEPTVVFWDHEIAGSGELEEAITFICNTFTDFLNLLHEPKEE